MVYTAWESGVVWFLGANLQTTDLGGQTVGRVNVKFPKMFWGKQHLEIVKDALMTTIFVVFHSSKLLNKLFKSTKSNGTLTW